MTYDEAIAHYGNQTKLGEALGIGQAAVSAWHHVIPAHYQYQIEIITDGAMRADENLRVPGRVHVKAPPARRSA